MNPFPLLARTIVPCTLVAGGTLLGALPALCAPAPAAGVVEAALPASSPAWTGRSSAASEAAAARELLEILALDGSVRSPLLQGTADLAKTEPQQAASLFVRRFLERLEGARFNGLGEALYGEERQFQPEQVLPGADKLMQGLWSIDGQTLQLGEPGRVDWSAPWDKNKIYPSQVGLHTGSAFLPLGRAFLLTNDRKFLDRWVGYLEDWALNDPYFDTLHPLDTPDNVNSQTAGTMLDTLAILAQVQEPARNAKDAIPDRVVARVLRKYLMQALPYTVTYIRSNTHNWTPGTRVLRVAMLLPEFKASQFYFREARRRNLEDNAHTQNLPDGTENQQDHWYNNHYLKQAGVFPLMDVQSPLPGWNEWRNDYFWREQMRRFLKERATYLIRNRTAQNSLPVAWNGGFSRTPEPGNYAQAPEAFHDRTNQAVLRAVYGDGNADPGFNSDWFPYGGFNMVRQGWRGSDAHASFFCSPVPGAYGGFRSRSNNNVLALAAYGQDLLIDDATGHYMYPTSPLRVDGRDQFFHTGIYKVGAPQNHKVFQVNAWHTPPSWRWHASGNFNLMEGIYSGAFANPDELKRTQGQWGTDESLTGGLPRGTGINDVAHQRLVLLAREAGLWIVDDRLRSTGTHEYAQQWLFPVRPADDVPAQEIRSGPAFSAAKMTLDGKARVIRTNEPTAPAKVNGEMVPRPKANLSLHQFTRADLEYSAGPRQRGKEYGYYMYYSWNRVQSRWKGQGNQQVVTVAFPRAPGAGPEGDLKSTRQLEAGKAVGFEAVTPDGKTVQYLSSVEPDQPLTLGKASATGEALLLCGGQGMVLGATRFVWDGRAVTIPGPDFEFVVGADSSVRVTPIYRPIAPVKIGPVSNVFTQSVRVTLESATPGVQIRYTVDGSEPTPQSTLYTGPFELTQTSTVQARAYRPGVTANPPHLSGTHATPVAVGRFEKRTAPPVVTPPRPRTGLQVRYYEGPWQQLLLEDSGLQPKASALDVPLWDTSVIPATNPVINDAAGSRRLPYALEYSGFLDIPEDGVYTLEAPEEYIWPAVDAGYELNVWLGNQMGSGALRERVVGQAQWYPSTWAHGFGNWSVPLKKGMNPFRVRFVDYRTDGPQRWNRAGFNPFIWTGSTPQLRISGPGMSKPGPIPANWCFSPMKRP